MIRAPIVEILTSQGKPRASGDDPERAQITASLAA